MNTYRNPEHAFNAAIKSNVLSLNPSAINYAGNYMYMGTNANDEDLFKNINTREYVKN
jgi:hypothetical protein